MKYEYIFFISRTWYLCNLVMANLVSFVIHFESHHKLEYPTNIQITKRRHLLTSGHFEYKPFCNFNRVLLKQRYIGVGPLNVFSTTYSLYSICPINTRLTCSWSSCWFLVWLTMNWIQAWAIVLLLVLMPLRKACFHGRKAQGTDDVDCFTYFSVVLNVG